MVPRCAIRYNKHEPNFPIDSGTKTVGSVPSRARPSRNMHVVVGVFNARRVMIVEGCGGIPRLQLFPSLSHTNSSQGRKRLEKSDGGETDNDGSEAGTEGAGTAGGDWWGASVGTVAGSWVGWRRGGRGGRSLDLTVTDLRDDGGWGSSWSGSSWGRWGLDLTVTDLGDDGRWCGRWGTGWELDLTVGDLRDHQGRSWHGSDGWSLRLTVADLAGSSRGGGGRGSLGGSRRSWGSGRDWSGRGRRSTRWLDERRAVTWDSADGDWLALWGPVDVVEVVERARQAAVEGGV
jgi:hypothetical protein